jgi:hypothetical protein
MIHEALIIIYRVIVLFVLGCTVWVALDKKNRGYDQVIAALLTVPLLLRVLMIK